MVNSRDRQAAEKRDASNGHNGANGSHSPQFSFSERENIDQLIELLKIEGARGKKTVLRLADSLDVSPEKVSGYLEYIDSLPEYNIVATKDGKDVFYDLAKFIQPKKPIKLDSKIYFPDGKVVFGAISNTEFGNKYQRGDALHSFYEKLAHDGVKLVLACGELLAGPPSRNNHEELIYYDLETQVELLLKNLPRKKGITTMFITSKYKEGQFAAEEKKNVGEYIQRIAEEHKRNDLKYIGHIKQDVIMDVEGQQAIVRLAHLIGKKPYGISYPSQKMIESIQGGTKPQVLLLGHLYQLEMLPLHRGIWSFQVGGFLDQTPSMLNDRQGATVGGWEIELLRPTEAEKKYLPSRQVMVKAYEMPYFNAEYYRKPRPERQNI